MPRDSLAEINLLEIAPCRAAEWREQGERVVVERPRPRGSGLRGLGERVLFQLAVRHIRLDERASFAWRQLDGTRTVAAIAEAMRREFGDAIEPAEERLGELVRMLRREGMVAFPGWDDPGP